ncbi:MULTISPECIES: C40 family peptidase [unclassified Actinobaculum]|uniref:C40 family peptidase n=1 Tax=unclassified Actinobaculum TaxID=2609299 RepID=UPI001F0CB49D|nr:MULTISPECIES: C40 family peptidase [unclassified Actinobaculum]
MKNHKIGRLVSAFAACALASSALVLPAGADDVTDDDIAAAQAAETSTSQSITGIEGRLAELNAQRNELNMAAAEAEAANIEAQQDLSDAITEAVDAQEAANAAQEEVEAARSELGQISQAMYRDSAATVPGGSFVLGADSLNEAAEQSRAYELVGNNTNQKFQRFEALQTVAESLQEQAEAKAAAEEKVAAAAAQKADEAAQAAEAAEQEIAAIESERDDLINQLAEQKGTTAELERQQQEQKEAAAREQAEAEQQAVIAAAQEEAEQRAKQSAAAQPAASSNGGATTQAAAPAAPQPTTQPAPAATQPAAAPAPAVTTPTAQQPATNSNTASNGNASSSKLGSSGSASTAPAASTSGGSLRSQIVAYARQYVGVPYVWAGTTPAGWDCVGFVHYVFGHFGYNTPRRTGSSVGQYWGGYTIVPASQAQPGDIMFWPGHVGIYTGNGMHIAAWNPSMGTQERAVWGNPVYLRVVG